MTQDSGIGGAKLSQRNQDSDKKGVDESLDKGWPSKLQPMGAPLAKKTSKMGREVVEEEDRLNGINT